VFISHFRLKTAIQKGIFALRDFADYGTLHPARELKRVALSETVQYIRQSMPGAVGVESARQVMEVGLAAIKARGHVLEFGVFRGGTIRFIAGRLRDQRIHGFDSFEGLPESWTGDSFTFDARGKLPAVPTNVSLYAGWFSESLPRWMKDNSGPIAFLHIDSDLYSSAKCVFDHLEGRIVPGTVIVFDEYFNYPGWIDGEHKAFMELKDRLGLEFEYLAYARFQVAVRIIGLNFEPRMRPAAGSLVGATTAS
jgi:hypothetical protein